MLAVVVGLNVEGLRDRLSRLASLPSMPSETAPVPQMIVVLPFENLGPSEDEYFAAGMTDEITSRLGAVSGLGIISRKRALRYAGTEKTTREIGEELGVGYILVGSVRWASGGDGSTRVRITPELIRASDGTQLWSEPYDRVIDDIFEVQSDIAGQVIQRLGVKLLDKESTPLTARPTENLEAYTLYLKGRHFWNKRTESDIQTALDYFQESVDLDPGYALAHVGIADVWIFRGWYSVLAPKETFPRAKAAALRALQFNETLAEAHTSLAHIHFEFDHDWEAARKEYERGIELNPRHPTAHHWYGGFLSAMGEPRRRAETSREGTGARSAITDYQYMGGPASLLRGALRGGHRGISEGAGVGFRFRPRALAFGVGIRAGGPLSGGHRGRATSNRNIGRKPTLHRLTRPRPCQGW